MNTPTIWTHTIQWEYTNSQHKQHAYMIPGNIWGHITNEYIYQMYSLKSMGKHWCAS